MRELLNLESGLNDGICVPIVVLLLGLAAAPRSRASRWFTWLAWWSRRSVSD
jgi:NhaP-type Na+/H+ or K+/H+ antiporter